MLEISGRKALEVDYLNMKIILLALMECREAYI